MNLLNAKEVAEKLKVSPLTVIRLVDAGELRAIDVAPGSGRRSLRFRTEDIETFLIAHEKRTETGQGAMIAHGNDS